MDTRKQRLLLAGGLLLVLGLIYRFYPSLMGVLPSDAALETKQEQVLHLETQLSKLQGMQSSLDKMHKHLDQLESRLFSAETPSLAAVEIQKMLSDISRENGAQIDSIEVLAVSPVEGQPYVEIPVRFVLLARIHQLKSILYGIESHNRLMAVKEATLRPRGTRNDDDTIYVVLTVTGLMKSKQP